MLSTIATQLFAIFIFIITIELFFIPFSLEPRSLLSIILRFSSLTLSFILPSFARPVFENDKGFVVLHFLIINITIISITLIYSKFPLLSIQVRTNNSFYSPRLICPPVNYSIPSHSSHRNDPRLPPRRNHFLLRYHPPVCRPPWLFWPIPSQFMAYTRGDPADARGDLAYTRGDHRLLWRCW